MHMRRTAWSLLKFPNPLAFTSWLIGIANLTYQKTNLLFTVFGLLTRVYLLSLTFVIVDIVLPLTQASGLFYLECHVVLFR